MEFEWDKGNSSKSFLKHGITDEEAEQAFFDHNKVRFPDPRHSANESRLIVVGKTPKNKILFVAFTKRGQKIRIISARPLNIKEAHLYEKTTHPTKI